MAPDHTSPASKTELSPAIRIPGATYRLQLSSQFDFAAAAGVVDYLARLGITDLYLSPLFRAREDSSHGYDVVDHAAIEPAFGGAAGFTTLTDQARDRGLGVLLDVVPNHMGIHDSHNRWWQDVLENGAASRYADCFDIDWGQSPEKSQSRLLLPVLGDHFGPTLERGELKLAYARGRFYIQYGPKQFPVTPYSWPLVLTRALERLGPSAPPTVPDDSGISARMELESLIAQLQHLPPRTSHSAAAVVERYREQWIGARWLERLLDESEPLREVLRRTIEEINGQPGEPRTFDVLETLLEEQWYRLAYWRVAAEEINYRRFFDINDLAAIRVERAEVFDAVHLLVRQWLSEGRITGLRIDHPDGLFDPRRYFEDLQQLYRRCGSDAEQPAKPARLYVVVEKILSGEEPLPEDWPVSGTTGYELLNDLSRLLVEPAGVETLRREYASLTGVQDAPAQVVYQGKQWVLTASLASELQMLARRLHRCARSQRQSRDFTFQSLRRALQELIACFPVYRTYIPPRGREPGDESRREIMAAVRLAKIRNPGLDWSTLDFVASVLLLEFPVQADEATRKQFEEFVLRFQQVTGPVTAKGVEDTAFYRYYPLASLNEVGGELSAKPWTADEFHRRMQHRALDWPHGLSATATHDTKRGEDVRARLHVLSEVPETWIETARRWQELHAPLLRTVNGQTVPDRNETWLLYQTLVGTWPLDSFENTRREEYTERITTYLRKALREAKVNTSWANPAEDYEEAAVAFTRDLLDPQQSSPFLQEMQDFVTGIASAGFINGLSQTLLKCTVPGVPDFYQGCELWDFNLVDPDNRRPVDYEQRNRWLEELQQRFQENSLSLRDELLSSWPDPRIKLFLVWRALQARATDPELFRDGSYQPLQVSGKQADHLLALARCHAGRWVVAVAPRHVQALLAPADRGGPISPPAAIDWGDTQIVLPAESPLHWQDSLFDQSTTAAESDRGLRSIPASSLLSPLPLALLSSSSERRDR